MKIGKNMVQEFNEIFHTKLRKKSGLYLDRKYLILNQPIVTTFV